ncbi:rhodanese-like domain-containing protein [Aneurinibacillus sp. Ricciae_BoGa-3]|uniref:rhodanese-like domain-containing protein n=1 Tax=Aneurinibacillus sp. Ricciae_BoGa-3 TaxID=3022697 RepID=UPI002340C0BF|nr:rhodanese-like domain-containing protein [Aneurinibacillus sp. Ricciae_BoGa-3]WCK55298.1 rhodanese-like domain-containing protein [Aneurinibacillus sp. Ricciae_BoGa-3]
MDILSITPDEFAEQYKNGKLDKECIIDVREPFEWEMVHLEGTKHIPMNEIPHYIDRLDKVSPLYIMCAHGVRSWHVQQYLLANGFEKIINVEGGISEVARFL